MCDVRKLDDVEHLADEAFRVFGDVHVVFNNAGIAYAGPIAQTSHDDWRFVIDVDLWGPIHGVEAFLPRLIAQGGESHIVFTSSFAGLIPNVGLGPYCVAKYGVVALAETLAREVRPNGIGVSVLCPMIVETNLLANTERVRSEDYGPAHSEAETVQQLASGARRRLRAQRRGRRTPDGRGDPRQPSLRATAPGGAGFDSAPLRAHRPHLRRTGRRGLDALTNPGPSWYSPVCGLWYQPLAACVPPSTWMV